MNKPGIVFIFVVVVGNTLGVDKVAELLGHMRTPDLSTLLFPKQWFQGEKGDSDFSRLPFPSFPLLLPKPWRGYLYLGLKVLFAQTVSELTFSDL